MTSEPCQRREHVPRRSSLVVAKQVFFEVGGAVLWRGSVVPFRGGFFRTSQRLPGFDEHVVEVAAGNLEDVFEVADANLVMPPKSTYFFPKARSGVLIISC